MREAVRLRPEVPSIRVNLATFLSAQKQWPEARFEFEQAIRLAVPRAAGGVVDIVARLWGDRVKPELGNVIIENQGGGGGVIAAVAVLFGIARNWPK